jgi:hypothetical protein
MLFSLGSFFFYDDEIFCDERMNQFKNAFLNGLLYVNGIDSKQKPRDEVPSVMYACNQKPLLYDNH